MPKKSNPHPYASSSSSQSHSLREDANKNRKSKKNGPRSTGSKKNALTIEKTLLRPAERKNSEYISSYNSSMVDPDN